MIFDRSSFSWFTPAEQGRDLVILLLRDRVELVIVAAGAVDRQAEERLPERARRGPPARRTASPSASRTSPRSVADLVPGPADEIARGDQGLEVVRVQHVAGDLLPDELVVGQVAVERLDHPVAVAPGVVADVVVLEALALAEPDDVQPVPRPSARRSGARRAGGRPASRRRRRRCRRRTARPPPGSGGRPIRSNESRRISVRRSASGAGCRSRASSCARTNRSMSLRGQPRIAHGRRAPASGPAGATTSRSPRGGRSSRGTGRSPASPTWRRRRSSASAAASRRRSGSGDPGASRRNRRSPAAGSRPACPAR